MRSGDAVRDEYENDQAEKQKAELPSDSSVTSATEGKAAESQTNLSRVVLLEHRIAEVERAANHSLDFRVDQFTNHDFSPRDLYVNNIWLEASQRLTRV
jgi:hypothetical protein